MSQKPFDPPPRAVFFDLDDTLCDYAAARKKRLRIAFTMRADGGFRYRPGVDLDAMIADSVSTHPHGADHFPELFAHYGIVDSTEAHAAATWYRNNRFHGLEFFSEATGVLRTIRTIVSAHPQPSTRPLGVITNGPAEVQSAKLELLGVYALVDFVIISEAFGASKPEPSIFFEALRQAEVSEREAVFVGDSIEFDMAGACAAGVPSVWLNRDDREWSERGWRPCREIQSLLALPALIDPGRAEIPWRAPAADH